MTKIKTIDDIPQNELDGARVIVRVDFNVPLEGARVSDDTRIRAALPTINKLTAAGARVILMSHLGRPSGTGFEAEYSLEPVAKHLQGLTSANVAFCPETVGGAARAACEKLASGNILLLENVRFDAREKKNDPQFCEELATLASIYVNDAFGTAHRAHASTAGIAKLLPAYAGYLMQREVETINGMLESPARPFVAILGGSKVSDKIKVIDALIERTDVLLIGGGMCFTFLRAQGYSVGTSLLEEDWVGRAAEMLEKAAAHNTKLLLPVDVVCASEFSNDSQIEVAPVNAIPDNMMGLDIGPLSVSLYAEAISGASTIFWNGPAGVFEMSNFEAGTKGVAEAIVAATRAGATSVIGGGDSVAAVNKYNLADEMSFISTGGGASMELVQGEALPGVEALKC